MFNRIAFAVQSGRVRVTMTFRSVLRNSSLVFTNHFLNFRENYQNNLSMSTATPTWNVMPSVSGALR